MKEESIPLLKDLAVEKYKQKNYAEALETFEELINNDYDLTKNKCLFQYLWAIFYVRIKIDNKQIEQNYSEFQKNVKLIMDNQTSESLLYQLTIFKVIDFLEDKQTTQSRNINVWLDKLNPDLLSINTSTFTSPDGKIIVMASSKEKWYAQKTKALENLEIYQECKTLCEKALTLFDEFHNGNDIWFKRRIAKCEAKLGNKEKALDLMFEIYNHKKDWFIDQEIGDIYLDLNEYDKALEYYITAALTSGEDEKKIKLFWSMAKIFEHKQMLEEASLHKRYVISIKQRKEWNIRDEYKEFLRLHPIDENISEKELRLKLKKTWNTLKWGDKKELFGDISNLLSNRTAGFIKSCGNSYYFKIKEFKDKKEKLAPGLKVKFYLEKSFDPKKNQQADIAVNIRIA